MHQSVNELALPSPVSEIVHPEIHAIHEYGTVELTALAAAHHILQVPTYNPSAAITYATGQTMIPVLESLATLAAQRIISFSNTKLFHLDERYPCRPDDPASFVKFLRERAQEPLGILDDHAFYIDGLAPDPAAEARRYELLLSQQPIDLAIIGFGPLPDVHIGFNETGTPFSAGVHAVHLGVATLHRDRVERGETVSDSAITQGPANIFAANKIVGVAFGRDKGLALIQALYAEIGPHCSASGLRLPNVGHKVTLFIDSEAAAQLNGR